MTERKSRQPPEKFSPHTSKKRNAPGLHRSPRRKRHVERTGRPARSFKTVVSSTVDILRASGLKYAVTGGAALPFYGRVRTTTDIDIIVEHDKRKLKRLVTELNKARFKIPWEWVEQSIKERSHFTVQDKFSPYRLDIKALQPGEDLGRTTEIKLYGRPTHIAAPEELVVHKLRFGGDIDIEDARSIIMRQGRSLDIKYMLRKAGELSVRDELIKLLREENVEFE